MRAKADLDYPQAGFNSASSFPNTIYDPIAKNLHARIAEDEG
jgi:hypothetical protein